MLGFMSFKVFYKFNCSLESPSHLIFSKLLNTVLEILDM